MDRFARRRRRHVQPDREPLSRASWACSSPGLERQNPKALIEAEKENLRQQIARYNENLANHAGFCERLLRQVKNLEGQERDLAAKAAANLRSATATPRASTRSSSRR